MLAQKPTIISIVEPDVYKQGGRQPELQYIAGGYENTQCVVTNTFIYGGADEGGMRVYYKS